MKILDLSAGNRAIWVNKQHPLVTFLDRRESVNPTVVCDTRAIPEVVGYDFDLLVFDPPHINFGINANCSKVYGHHTTAEIMDTIEKTSVEAHRVSRIDALMIFKWNDHDTPLMKVLNLMPHWEPLFGHITKDGPGSKTFWVCLRRLAKPTSVNLKLWDIV